MKEISSRQSLLSSMMIMASTLSTRLLGFLRIALISALFGGGAQVDVMNWAFNIPNNFRKLLAEGALSAAFIPEISRQLVEEPEGSEARRLTRSLIGLLLLLVVPLCLVFVLFPGAIVSLISDFPDRQQSLMAASMLRLVINYLLFVALSALLMAVLNSHNRFFIPAITPLLYSISVISALLLLHRRLGIYSMAVGILAGGILQILFQIPSVWKLGYRPLPSFNFRSEAFRRVMSRWLPIMVTSSIFAVNQFIAQYFASRLEEGSVTAMTNALVFWQLPFGIFFNSISTVTFPKLSRQFSRGDLEDMGGTVTFAYSALGSLLLPSAVILMLMAPQIIAVALQRGAHFQLEHSILAAKALLAYSTGLLSVGLYNFTQRVFYSMGDMQNPMKAALITMFIDVVLTLYFVPVLGWGVAGLAYANTLAFTFGFLWQLWALRKKLPLTGLRKTLLGLARVLPAMIPAFAWEWGFRRIFGTSWWQQGSSWSNFALLALEGLIFVGLTLAGFLLFKIPILSILKKRGPLNEEP